jgi:AbrB family looped-hinge helix DNA binding protein
MKIGERGQVTIPKKVREKYGLFPNMEVEFVSDAEGVRLRKKTRHTSPVRTVYGILKKGGRTDDYVEDIRGK